MGVRNCQKCGKIFNYIAGPPVCMNCRKVLEETFTVVRKFVRRNPQATIPEIAEECSTDMKQIRQWIREERLSFSDDSAVGIECEKCGKSIKTGRFCEECKVEVANELKNAYRKEPKSEPVNEYKDTKKDTKMRFLNRDE